MCHSLKEVRELRVKLSVFIPRGVFLRGSMLKYNKMGF